MKHDICLRIEGSMLERLINRALQAGACFGQINRNGKRTLLISTDEHSASILSALCEKYFLDCRILHRSGFPALRNKLRKRWTLLPAMLLCGTICTLFLSRIWQVDICFSGTHPELGNREAILSLLAEHGVKPGISAKSIDCDVLQKQLFSEAGDYSFIGVHRQGIRLLVEAAPEIPSPETYQIAYARDLIAARDGVIESVTVLAGTACVKPGDTVHAGQILIRGEEVIGSDPETQEEITAPVSALGEVIARCWYEGSADGYINTTSSVRTGRSSTHVRLKLMDFSLPLLDGENYRQQEVEKQSLPVVGMFLPLELERITCFETRDQIHVFEPKALESLLEPLARADARKALSSNKTPCQIASHWTDVNQTDNIMRLRAVYEIYTDIATTRDAFIEEVY